MIGQANLKEYEMKTFKTKAGTELPLMDMRGKDYLQVAHRLVWFHEEHPDWSIETQFITLTEQYAAAKATIKDASGRVMSTAHKTETVKDFPAGHGEKAETGAVGRALAMIGYGTQFAPDLDEGERIVDSPIQRHPSAVVSAPKKEILSGVSCEACGQELILSKAGTGWFCKNFKSPSPIEHTRLPVSKLEEFKNRIKADAIDPNWEDNKL